MKTPVVIAGYNRIGKRVADAVAAQPDMMVRGVLEDDGSHARLIHARGHQLLAASSVPAALPDAITVQCSQMEPPIAGRSVLAPRVTARDPGPGFTCLSPTDLYQRHHRIQAATANTLAVARVASALRRCGRIKRWLSTVIVPPLSSPLVDGLDPLEQDAFEDTQVARELAGIVPDVCLSRVAAPYTHSHLHLTQIDFDGFITCEDVMEALATSPRIVIGRARDGWKSTADVQEFCRDIGRPRGDRPEVFIWHESIHAAGRTLYLMMDVEPDATPIPEMIDAVRLLASPAMSVIDSVSITDRALQLGVPFKSLTRKTP